MRRLVIRPFPRLDDVLGALGNRVGTSSWSGRNLHYCSTDEKDIPALEGLGRGDVITGRELLDSLPTLAIVIDGEFTATEGSGEPWVVLKAVDSTWLEVLSADPGVLAAARSRFEHAVESA